MSVESTIQALFAGGSVMLLVLTVQTVANIGTSYIGRGGMDMQEWLESKFNRGG